jgi:hypothetical protein
LRKDPFNPGYCYIIASTYRHLAEVKGQDYSSEIEIFLKKAIKNYPTNPQYHLKLARFYESVGREEEALLEYAEVRRLGVDSISIRNAMRKLKKDR